MTYTNKRKALLDLIFYVINQSIIRNKITEGVSGAAEKSKTHMGLDNKPNRREFLTAVGLATVGAAVTAAAASTPLSSAFAGDAKAANWTPELRELHAASSAASDYAEGSNGVGILIHVGTEIKSNADAHKVGRYFVNQIRSHPANTGGYGAQYFLSQNDVRATGVTYHLGHQVHGAEDGTEVKPLREALQAIPDVLKQLKIVKELAQAPDEPGIQEPS